MGDGDDEQLIKKSDSRENHLCGKGFEIMKILNLSLIFTFVTY